MKEWKKPELKVLGVENTFEGIDTFGIQAGNGFKWVCAICYGDERNDIDDRGTVQTGDIYYTPEQNCGVCKVSHKWIKVDASFLPPTTS